MKMIQIDILDDILVPEWWYMHKAHKHLTGHTHFRSPFESDDSCGTCDGAKCDSCKEIMDAEDLESAIPADKLYNILVEKKNVPEDIATELVYSDSCGNVYRGYYLHFPSGEELKTKYPEKYDEILKIKIAKEEAWIKEMSSK